MNDHTVDVGIITFIYKEVEALLKIFDAEKEKIKIGGQIYFRTSLHSNIAKRDLNVVLTFSEPGNTESAIITTKFLYDWCPRIMCLVGIAAGIKGKTNIGDVIIPSLIHDYSKKTFINQQYSPQSKDLSRADDLNKLLKLNPLNHRDFNRLCSKELSGDIDSINEALNIIQKDGKESGLFKPIFLIHDGNLVSDNTLIRDDHYFQKIVTGNNDKCQGGEMESAGFVRACQIERPDYPWLVVRGVSDYGDGNKSDTYQSLAAKSATIALRELLTRSIEIDDLKENPKASNSERKLQFDIIKQLRKANENEDWKTVCTLGTLISRYLYLASQYSLSIEIGKLVENAAVQLEDDDVLAKILIEDLGWTQFLYGDKSWAKTNILNGLSAAGRVGNHYLSAKGYRHLASIKRRSGYYSEAQKHLDNATKEAAEIVDKTKKAEIEASLLYSNAQLKYAKLRSKRQPKAEDIKSCINEAEEAQKAFLKISDSKRAVKIYRFIGDLYCELNDFTNAIDQYSIGLDDSLDIHRYDTIKENGNALLKLTDHISKEQQIDILLRLKQYCEVQNLSEEMAFWSKELESIRKKVY